MSLLTTLLPAKLVTKPTRSDIAAGRAERRGEIDQVITEWTTVTEAKSHAIAAVEVQARKIAVLDDASAPLTITEDEYQQQHTELRRLRRERDDAIKVVERFEVENDIPALRAERAELDEADARDARVAHRKVIKGKFVELLHELEQAQATHAEILLLFDQAQANWPRELSEVLADFALLPLGFLAPNGRRSIPDYLAEMLALADIELLPPDHPVRRRIEVARERGDKIVTWAPAPLLWG
jgi:hypothetical protein